MWAPSTLPDAGPLYLAIADALGRDIACGDLQPGERLPTHRDLARVLGVNVMTVTRGYAEAARRGLVDGEVGRGTFVRTHPRADAPIVPSPPLDGTFVDFHFNLPVSRPELLDPGAVLSELAADPNGAPLFTGYSTTGLDEHREAGAAWIRAAGIPAEADRVLVCGGVQHAMTVALSALTVPGDVVLTEELTYPGIKALANVLHLRLGRVAMDEHGLLPDALESACRRSGARILYTMPTVHNPTGVVLDEERRHATVAVARRHGLTILEDDTYAFFRPDPPPALATLAPERCVHLVGTSKSLAAGLRVGFLMVPREPGPDGLTVERASDHVAAIAWMAAPLMAELVARWIRNGAAARLVAWKRQEARARRALFERLLGAHPVTSDPGSGHVWFGLPVPWRCADLVSLAQRRGVAVTPSEAFVVGRAGAPQAVRVCLSTPPTRAAVQSGLEVLAGLLERGPEARSAIV